MMTSALSSTDDAVILHLLRAAVLRLKLAETDLTEIGVCLKAGAVDADTAIRWIRDEGLAHLLVVETTEPIEPHLVAAAIEYRASRDGLNRKAA